MPGREPEVYISHLDLHGAVIAGFLRSRSLLFVMLVLGGGEY
jgi:hypothetical protein